MATILIIDDDTFICKQLDLLLKKQGHHVRIAYTANNGIKELKRGGVDFVLCDYRLPDANGDEIFRRVKKREPYVPVVIMTAYADVRTAVQMIRAGAFDYITKPFLQEEIIRVINRGLKESPDDLDGFENRFISGEDPAMQNVMQHVEMVAPADLSVLIEGETGSGKEFIARAIHHRSQRKDKPFVALDCGALPGELANSELFGHVKGAFTGAIQDKVGCFEAAEGGTLFLDEIGNLTHENQVRLLRTIQEKAISRLGDNRVRSVDVRIISATNEDLMKDVTQSNFREDLYHRINGFKITLPPLRQRKHDVFVFAERFRENANQSLGKKVPGFDEKVKEIFLRYPWPGNIRELENIIYRCVLLEQGDKISPNTLPEEIRRYADLSAEKEELKTRLRRPMSLKEAAIMAEREAIIMALKTCSYNKTKAADILKVDRKTLYNKMREYSIKTY